MLGVAENKGLIELNVFNGFPRFEVVFFCFSGKTDDNVCGNGDVGAGFLHLVADIDEALRFIGTMHL